jgi:hypothetical protein
VKVDDHIEPLAPKATCQGEIIGETANPTRALRHDDAIEMRVVPHDRFGRGLDQIGHSRVWIVLANGGDRWCGEYDVADQTKSDEQDVPRGPRRAD